MCLRTIARVYELRKMLPILSCNPPPRPQWLGENGEIVVELPREEEEDGDGREGGSDGEPRDGESDAPGIGKGKGKKKSKARRFTKVYERGKMSYPWGVGCGMGWIQKPVLGEAQRSSRMAERYMERKRFCCSARAACRALVFLVPTSTSRGYRPTSRVEIHQSVCRGGSKTGERARTCAACSRKCSSLIWRVLCVFPVFVPIQISERRRSHRILSFALSLPLSLLSLSVYDVSICLRVPLAKFVNSGGVDGSGLAVVVVVTQALSLPPPLTLSAAHVLSVCVSCIIVSIRQEETKQALTIHKAHLACLVARCAMVSRWAGDPTVQAAMVSCLPGHLLSKVR